MENSFYRQIINEHNLRPFHKHGLDCDCMEQRGLNPGCGDDITVRLVVSDGVITDAAFTGDGCAISQASADIMMDMIRGMSTEEARALAGAFTAMIRGTATESQKDLLGEALALEDVSHMPARVKCALLAWHTMDEMLKE